MSEAWKPLPPANGGVYEISNLGNLRLVTTGAALFPVTFTPISLPVDAKSYGPLTKPRRRSGIRSLSRDQVLNIRMWLKNGKSISSIARTFDVNSGSIYQIKNGTTYKDVK